MVASLVREPRRGYGGRGRGGLPPRPLGARHL